MKAEENTQEEDVLKNESAASENSTEEVKEEAPQLTPLEEMEIQVKELNDKYLRLYSEFDNYRKRTQKERLEMIQTAGEDVIKMMLPIIDDFERAQKSMDEKADFQMLKDGVDLIYNKLLNSLATKGLTPMSSSIGEKFDSDIQEAITQVPAPSEDLKGKVIDEVEKGYMLKEKVIRFAKVVVGQ
ncbi:nucleotide exchange factor GrpE [Cryomorphaceae bacterium S-15]|uniref:Protein GrpE n=2 Tax=Acidiluteibacter ferrifornacis TaxID=2692424 RepID=A0A6N9NGT1_9FLAO|nr:nucleotide exchange factor GrpE [bacterium]NBG65858.1 nucleotide exchange factor GrpE [Acidiluteibacter ferrifornacis]